MSGTEVDWSKFEGWHQDKPFEFYTEQDREIATRLWRGQSSQIIAHISNEARTSSDHGSEFTQYMLDNGYAAGP